MLHTRSRSNSNPQYHSAPDLKLPNLPPVSSGHLTSALIARSSSKNYLTTESSSYSLLRSILSLKSQHFSKLCFPHDLKLPNPLPYFSTVFRARSLPTALQKSDQLSPPTENRSSPMLTPFTSPSLPRAYTMDNVRYRRVIALGPFEVDSIIPPEHHETLSLSIAQALLHSQFLDHIPLNKLTRIRMKRVLRDGIFSPRNYGSVEKMCRRRRRPNGSASADRLHPRRYAVATYDSYARGQIRKQSNRSVGYKVWRVCRPTRRVCILLE